MRRFTKRWCCAVALLSFSACTQSQGLPNPVVTPGAVAGMHGLRVRLTGYCRIEFEGNAIYPSEADYRARRLDRAVWLSIGWPVDAASTAACDQRRVIVDGTYNADHKGHYGMYQGSLEDVTGIVPSF